MKSLGINKIKKESIGINWNRYEINRNQQESIGIKGNPFEN